MYPNPGSDLVKLGGKEKTPKAEMTAGWPLLSSAHYFILEVRSQTIPFPVSCLKLTFRINTQVGAYTEFVLF